MIWACAIDVEFPGQNEYIRRERAHRMAAAQLKKKFTRLAQGYIAPFARPLGEGPFIIRLVWFIRSARMDVDNAVAFGTKCVLDALVHEGVIPDDSPRYVVGLEHVFAKIGAPSSRLIALIRLSVQERPHLVEEDGEAKGYPLHLLGGEGQLPTGQG